MNKNLFLFLILFLIPLSSAETIIYDTVTTSDMKSISISDDVNIAYINSYQYDVFLNGRFLGTYSKGEKIFVPDGSNISIFLPPSNIKTNIGELWDSGKTQFYIAVMYLVSGFIIVAVLVYFIRRLWK